MNEKVLTTLEYDKIVALISSHLASDVGREAASRLRPAGSLADAETLLTQTWEADAIYRRTGRTPIDGFPDIRDLLRRVHAALALSAGELLQVAACLRVSRCAREVLHDGDAEGLLAMMANRLTARRSVEEEIARCILSEDEIADNASPELVRIRRQIRIVNERVREKLNAMIRGASSQKYLQESIITMRNGRFALPVKAEYRNEVPGLVHDQSGSGATLFIEPAACVELGNEHKRLLAQERTEIERILAGLTAMVDPLADELAGSLVILGALDLIFAKAVTARDMRAHRPMLTDDGRIFILKGRHPLLPKESVVPVDIWLGDAFTTLIITGPNTGGKTVTLKTVGLFTLMAMSGLFVPADEGTRLSVFSGVFADIGDEQSIEQSLSTFSSHTKNIVRILESADERSLVLLDELGAGTDPVEGAALAQAILETLFKRGARTVATTHYSEIKAFALTKSGMQNASMEFDVDRLCPTYRLFIGIPGKSNAFEISRRLGLDEAVISRAAEYLGKKDVAFEDVLSGAEEARRNAEAALREAKQAQYDAERIRGELTKEKQKLEDEKTLLRQKAKEDARRMVTETRAEMENLIRELRKIKDIDPKALERAIQEQRDAMRKTEERLSEQMTARESYGEAPKSLRPGDRVKLITMGQEATVLKAPDARGEVQLQAGIIKLSAQLADLRVIEPPKKKQTGGSRVVLAPQRESGFLELDLRGKLVDEAILEIDRYIDDAHVTGLKEFSVIHGKGTGALRAGVQNYLRSHPAVKSFRIGAYGEGDAGVTVVTLK